MSRKLPFKKLVKLKTLCKYNRKTKDNIKMDK